MVSNGGDKVAKTTFVGARGGWSVGGAVRV